jgi:3-dehydroquinate synthetase
LVRNENLFVKSKLAHLIEDLSVHARTLEGLRSLTLHGSQAKGREHELLFYTDLDVIFIFEDQFLSAGLEFVDKYFDDLSKNHSSDSLNIMYRIESGPMHPFRKRGGDESISPLRIQKIIFFHVSVFAESFYKGTADIRPGLSPLLVYSWQESEPLVGAALRTFHSLDDLGVKDVLESGLGILDSIQMLKERRTHFWRWIRQEDGQYQMYWDSAAFEDFEVFEFPLYVARWAVTNSVRAFKALVPVAYDTESLCDVFLRQVILSGEHNELVRSVFSQLSKIQDLMAEYSESPAEFMRNHAVDDLYQRVLQLLESIRSRLTEISETDSKEYSFRLADQSIPINVAYRTREALNGVLCDVLPDQVFILSDENVSRFYDLRRWLDNCDFPVNEAILKPGESEKSLDNLISLLRSAEKMGLNQQSLLITFGGGNVGNLGGLIAGLVCRGISFVHIPTSLVAQLDSAIGAKQSVNGELGKNYFGLYHPPRSVLINPLFLSTLPASETRSGLVESMKHGFCQSAELVNLVKQYLSSDWGKNGSMLSDILRMTISFKIEYMEIDPYESDPKQFLELGHKVGHALEQLGSGQFSHGFCVAFGMVAESLFFERRRQCDEFTTKYIVDGVRSVYDSSDFSFDIADREIAGQILFDNKRAGNLIPFAYLRSPQVPSPASVRLTDEVIDELSLSIQQAKELLKTPE